MPELPDVEHAMRRLKRWMRGAKITSARSTDTRVLRPGSPAAFHRALSGRRVRSIDRRGKWLRIELEGDVLLFSHLGMTGEWVAASPDDPKRPSERARLDLSGSHASGVRYLDARRFGRLLISEQDIPEWTELGPDPLLDRVTAASLEVPLRRRKRAVKEVLMDQTVLAGVGNILATEALWRARIDPRSRSDALSRREIGAVLRGLDVVIRRELKDLASPDGEPTFQVYGRSGEPCPRCKTTLSHIVLGGRGTTFCGDCQVRVGAKKSRPR